MQCVAVFVLQCVGVCCSVCVSSNVAVEMSPVCCSVLQSIAASCSVLQCVAVCCSVCASPNFCSCKSKNWFASVLQCLPCGFVSVLQCVAVCCSVLQCVAVYAPPQISAKWVRECVAVSAVWVRECVAVCCSFLQRWQRGLVRVLQCVAVCCSVGS